MEPLRKVMAWTVLVVWVVSVVLSAVDRTYQPDPTVHVLMVAIVTALFAAPAILGRRGSSNADDKEDGPS